MQTRDIDEKWLQGNRNSPQVFVWHLPGIPFYPLLQKAKGQIVG
jgi:hypothetical protein